MQDGSMIEYELLADGRTVSILRRTDVVGLREAIPQGSTPLQSRIDISLLDRHGGILRVKVGDRRVV